MNNRNIEIKIKNRPLFYYMLVMVIFLLTLKILIMLNGRVYVWYLDGASQHLSALTYYSAYLREILSGIFHGDFTFPKWDLAIGEGSDILAVFHYYCIGDPIALLSVFFSSDNRLHNFFALPTFSTNMLFFSTICTDSMISSINSMLLANRTKQRNKL